MPDSKFDIGVILRIIDGFTKPINKFQKQMVTVGRKMQDAGKTASLKLSLPIAAFGANAIRMGANFDASMNMVRAVTNSTGEVFQNLESQARKLGATTQFTAKDAADAMKFMGMAGMDANEILGAAPSVLQLAAAAQLDMASAADIVTNVMKGYGIQVSELSNANNILVDTFTATNVDLSMLGASMRKVGPLASNLKISFEDTAAAIGALGNAGIQGEEAGTGLKTILTRLISPTKAAQKVMDFYELSFRNANGTVRSFPGIVAEFENAMKKGADETELMGAAVEIFGTRGIQIISALTKTGSKEIAKLSAKLGLKDKDGLGSAARIAKMQMEGLPGALKLLTSAWEALNIAFVKSGFGKFINSLLRGFAKFIQYLSEAHPTLLVIIAVIGGIVAAMGPLLIAIGMMSVGMAVLSTVSLPVVAVVLAIIAVIGALIALAVLIYKKWGPIKNFFKKLWAGVLDAIKKPWDIIKDLFFTFHPVGIIIKNWGPIKRVFSELFKFLVLLAKIAWEKIKGFFLKFLPIEEIKAKWDSISNYFGNVWGGIKEGAGETFDFIGNTFSDFDPISRIKAIWEPIRDYFKDIFEKIKSYIPNFFIGFGRKLEAINKGLEAKITPKSVAGIVKPPTFEAQKSQTEVLVKVQAEKGTTSKIEEVKSKGEAKVGVENKSDVGPTMMAVGIP